MAWCRSVIFLSLCGAAVSVASAGGVTSVLSRQEAPERAQSFKARCALSAGAAKWRIDLINFRAHGNRSKTFAVRSSNGRTFGFCELFAFFALEVNGIPDWKLQLDPSRCREFAEGEARGVEYFLNFDGALVRTRFWMTPDSPTLEGEVRCARQGLSSATNLVVRIGAVPSALDRGASGGWRFEGYRRFAQTRTRRIGPFATRQLSDIQPQDGFFVLGDCDADGTEEGKGNGPVAVLLQDETPGQVEVGPGWMAKLVLQPSPAAAFRFSLLEFSDRRLSNEAFIRRVREVADRADARKSKQEDNR